MTVFYRTHLSSLGWFIEIRDNRIGVLANGVVLIGLHDGVALESVDLLRPDLPLILLALLHCLLALELLRVCGDLAEQDLVAILQICSRLIP